MNKAKKTQDTITHMEQKIQKINRLVQKTTTGNHHAHEKNAAGNIIHRAWAKLDQTTKGQLDQRRKINHEIDQILQELDAPIEKGKPQRNEQTQDQKNQNKKNKEITTNRRKNKEKEKILEKNQKQTK